MNNPPNARRNWLKTAAGAAAALACAPGWARPARADDFSAAYARQPLLRPLKGVDDLSGDRDASAQIRGRWPKALAGRFYRNGPALFERGGERYHHWFDGDGMVQQFTIGDGRVTHRGRLVRTSKLALEQREGRFVMGTFGTSIEGTPPAGGPDAFNTANTNAIEHAGRVLALWEGGSAYALDPKDLSTQGPITWRNDLAQVPFSAHPKVDAQGHLWNIGTAGKALIVWHIDPAGRLVDVQVGENPFPGGMAHDMAVTERHIVVPLPPVRLEFSHPAGDGPRRFEMAPAEPLRVLVVEKADITQRRVFELPPQMVFHVGNAWDTADGQVMLSAVASPDLWFLNEGAVALMQARTQARNPHTGGSGTVLLTLDLRSGRATSRSLPGEVEFPRVDPRRIGERTRWLVQGAAWAAQRRDHALLHGVSLTNIDSGRVNRFDYGAMAIAEEHILVPKPGQGGELDAWLLGTTYDARSQRTVLNVLEASRIEDGPIAQAVLPYALPLGFHGNFTAA
jgi:all-trans-8'-apo-beta-carotenal 15,15'-oxygenase